MSGFEEPIDVPDAQWRVSVLEEELGRIELQLADPRRKTDRASGRPLADDDYQAWRAKADDALYHNRRELGYLQAWLQRKGVVAAEPMKELVIATEDAVPWLLGMFTPLSKYPPIERLLEVFAFITGAFKRQ
jgi:hypothetical protein